MTPTSDGWQAVASQLASALSAIRQNRSWRGWLAGDVVAQAQDKGALAALEAFVALGEGSPTHAERLAKRLLADWGSPACEELDDGQWFCSECEAEGPSEAQVAHGKDCVLGLAQQLVKGGAP